MTETKFEELPLLYKNPKYPGTTLILSYDVNSLGVIKQDKFIWAIQKDNKDVEAHGKVKNLKKLDEIRNKFGLDGWERFMPPKFKVKEKEEVKEPAVKVTLEEVENRLVFSDKDKAAREKAMADIQKHINDTKWDF